MPDATHPNWPTSRRPAALRIYDLERPAVDERSVRRLASRFGLPVTGTDGRLQIDAQKLSYAVGSRGVTVYRASGALRYQDSSRWQVDDGSDVRMPQEAAVEIARRYIRATGAAPVAECQLAAVTRLRVGVADMQGREHEERVIDLGVIFQRMVNGTPVDGPGGKVIVYIDAGGNVTGLDRTWRTIRGVREKVDALRSADEVMRRVRRFWGASVVIDVTQVRLGYFEQGPRTLQQTLQPAYVVMVNLRAAGSEESRRSVYVQAAATNSVGELQPARSRPRPQRARPRGRGTGRAPVG